MRTSEAIGFARIAEGEGQEREIEGMAVPYGVVSEPTELVPGTREIVRETWQPGAFRESVAKWNAREDGRRMPLRPEHGAAPVGVVTELADQPGGVAFRARVFAGDAGDAYLAQVANGLNGISMEGIWNDAPRKTRDGVLVHRTGRLYGIAGSVNPAYDGAHVALRDMEDAKVADEPVTTTAEADAATVASVSPAERRAVETAAVAEFRPSISITRPEPIYGPRSEFSFLRDNFHGQMSGDAAAAERQARHYSLLREYAAVMERESSWRLLNPDSITAERAGDVLSSEIPGAYPNDYLPGLLTPRIFKGRPMADFYGRVAIADARPRIFPKVTTSTTVASVSEGAAPSATDFATTAVTVTPTIYAAYTDVSRPTIDGADPAAQSMVFQDLYEAYSQVAEGAVKTAVEAGSTASGVAITAATPYAGTLANVVNYYAVRFLGASGAFIPSALFSVLAAQGDTTGRPFLPMIGAVNSDGTTLATDVSLDLAVLTARTKLSWQSTANVCVFARPADFVIYESAILSFTYDQAVGPQAFRMGVWAYLGIGTRLGSLKVTAA